MADDARWPVRPVPAALRERYLAEGWWTDDTLGAARRPVAAGPRRTPPCDIWSETRPWHGTYADDPRRRAAARDRCSRTPASKPGDVVAFQLPNWREAVVAFYGLAMGGYVLVPIVHIYGREGGALHPRAERRPGVHLGGPLRPRRLPRHRRRRRADELPRLDAPPGRRATRRPAPRTGVRRRRVGGRRRPTPPADVGRRRPTPTTCACSRTRRARRATRRA